MGFCYLPPERVKMGCCCLPPERVKLTMNSKKETSSRVKMGQGSRWAFVIYPLKESKWAKGQNGPRILWLKSAVETIESNWAKRSQVGPRSQDGSEHSHGIGYVCPM